MTLLIGIGSDPIGRYNRGLKAPRSVQLLTAIKQLIRECKISGMKPVVLIYDSSQINNYDAFGIKAGNK